MQSSSDHGTDPRFRQWLVGAAASVLIVGTMAHGDVVSVSGNCQLISPPASVEEGQLTSNDFIRVFNEDQGVILQASLTVNATAAGHFDQNGDLSNSEIPAGTRISSHHVHFDSTALFGSNASGSVTFDHKILGVIENDQDLYDSDSRGGRRLSGVPLRSRVRARPERLVRDLQRFADHHDEPAHTGRRRPASRDHVRGPGDIFLLAPVAGGVLP